MKHCSKCKGTGLEPIRQHIVDTIKCVSVSEPATSRRVADLLSISIENASNRLRNLHESGMLVRAEHLQQSGGVVYLYEVAQDGWMAISHKEDLDSRC